MTRSGRDGDLRIRGMGLAARFVTAMAVTLAIVVLIAGFALYRSSTRLGQVYRQEGIADAAKQIVVPELDGTRLQVTEGTRREHGGGITSEEVTFEGEDGWYRGRLYRDESKPRPPIELLVHLPHDPTARGELRHLPLQSEERERLETALIEDFPRFTERGPLEDGPRGVKTRRVKWIETVETRGRLEDQEHVGVIFAFEPSPAPTEWIVPVVGAQSQQSQLRIILVVMMVVVLVGAGVALWAGSQIVRPINDIIEDIRKISKGDLDHKTRVRGGGEIELLGRTIDRMTRELREARDAELELGIRQREYEFAEGVREALLPIATPLVEGYDVGAAHLSGHLGGDFHDFIELGDGRVGLLVCDVSGQGVPAALIGATARAYLRRVLSEGGDMVEGLRHVNRELARDVRRGMYVTALYALLDPGTHEVRVACAGHKVPLLRYTAADSNLRLVQPDGIALGFDKGPVFDRRLELAEFRMEPGDRLLLSNSGPVRITSPDGTEMGEKPFYASMLRAVNLPTPKFLRGLRQTLTEYAGEDGPNVDVSLVTVLREG